VNSGRGADVGLITAYDPGCSLTQHGKQRPNGFVQKAILAKQLFGLAAEDLATAGGCCSTSWPSGDTRGSLGRYIVSPELSQSSRRD
jgi:hypothetical protein